MMQNPYKTKRQSQRPVMKHIQADVSENDWNIVYLMLPFRGTEDTILSTLVHALAQAIKQQNLHALPYESREIALEKLIRGCSFPSVDGAGLVENESVRAASPV
jgi:hypothetical protein